MISRTRQVLVSPSTYSLTVFWLMATVILPLAVSGALTLEVGLGLLTFTALALIAIAFRRALSSM